MKKRQLLLLLAPLTVILLLIQTWTSSRASDYCMDEPEETANDWLFRQRAYPSGEIDMTAFKRAVKYREVKARSQREYAAKDLFDNPWVQAGPINVGGRVTDVERVVGEPSTIFVAAASGGIFRSQDEGANWTPIFDEQATLSIGDMALAPSNNNIIYVGTGEANAGGGSIAYDGLGVYRSDNGGDSWQSLGLEEVGSIGRIVVDPDDPMRVYAAAMGTLFSKNEERGVYRSLDGGANWEQVLFVSDSTGAIDLAMHPDEPLTLYAAMWERVRTPVQRTYHGATSGIYKSTDGGSTWVELTEDLPQYFFEKGRIGLAIAPSDPQRVYAAYADATGYLEGIYRSSNGGTSWENLSLSGLYSVPYEWWFNRLVVAPDDPDRVYYIGFNLYEYDASAGQWVQRFVGTHVDQHMLWIDPANPQRQLLGNDGGLYWTEDGGIEFGKWENLPITQFYTCEVDFQQPEQLYGGAQDNGTNRTTTGVLDDWEQINGGDGFRVLVDPTNSSRIYAESQYGNLKRSVDGGDFFIDALTGIANSARKNWHTPVILDPSNPSTLYYGAHRVYKSDNEAVTWNPISADLTNGAGGGNLTFGTITTLSVSPLDDRIIWAGTDDGNVWVTDNGGDSWLKVSTDLPDRWVTSVRAHPNDPLGAFVTYSGYRFGSNMSHIYQTQDLGDSWLDRNGDLPDIPVNDLEINPDNDLLYLATDIGVFFSDNEGLNWHLLGEGLPPVVITDIKLHLPTKQLIAATYGRSMWKVDVSEDVVAVAEPATSALSVAVFPNPFREELAVRLEVLTAGRYELRLWTTSGQLIRQQSLGQLPAGVQVVSWNLEELPVGVYYLQLSGIGVEQILRVVCS